MEFKPEDGEPAAEAAPAKNVADQKNSMIVVTVCLHLPIR